MAQSALTVTPPSPTPPNPPNFTKLTYADYADNTIFNTSPPPYFDDGTAGALHLFAANTAALASGSGATAGGTENSYPGAASGVVPASTSVAHEGAGTEVSVLAPGNIVHTYPGAVTMNTSQSVSDLGSYTNAPNGQHASSLSPATNPTFTSFTAGSSVSGVGTTTLSCVTVGATKQSVVYVNNVPQTTVFVSPTSLTCAAVTKKTTPGNWDIKIVTGGVVETAPRTWTFT
jgi:hypothetical protein